MRRQLKKPFPLECSFPDETDITHGQVAQATVDQLSRTAGGPGGEIAGFQHQGFQTRQRRMPGNAGTGNAAAHNGYVERRIGDFVEVSFQEQGYRRKIAADVSAAGAKPVAHSAIAKTICQQSSGLSAPQWVVSWFSAVTRFRPAPFEV